MSVKVDLTGLISAHAQALEELRSVPRIMERIGRDAAKYSRDRHQYVNRTGNAERETKVVTQTDRDATYMLVTINVPYGSYLMKGGTRRRTESLTDLEEGIEQAKKELEYFFDGIGSGLR